MGSLEKGAFPMTGMEKIKAKILEDSNAKASQIEEKAKLEAGVILDEASKEAEKKKNEIISKAEAESMEVYRRLLAVADLDGRKELLRAKRDVVENAFASAMAKLTELPDSEYQKLIESMVVKSAAKGCGEVIISAKDAGRIDGNFIKNINRSLSEAGIDGSVKLSDERINAAGGVVVRYGDMEVNNTFEILFEMLRPQLENDVVKILFEE
jgi:V/A-type H+-transporting ATPase subunit E